MISMYFGLPGCGKTTYLTSMAIKAKRSGKYDHVYTSWPVKGLEVLTKEDMERYWYGNSILFIDEVTLWWDSRGFKSFSDHTKELMTLHRHDKITIVLATQYYGSVDKRIRDLVQKTHYIERGLFFSKILKIPFGLVWPEGEKAGEVQMGLMEPKKMQRLFAARCLRRRWYKYFDSWETDHDYENTPHEIW